MKRTLFSDIRQELSKYIMDEPDAIDSTEQNKLHSIRTFSRITQPEPRKFLGKLLIESVCMNSKNQSDGTNRLYQNRLNLLFELVDRINQTPADETFMYLRDVLNYMQKNYQPSCCIHGNQVTDITSSVSGEELSFFQNSFITKEDAAQRFIYDLGDSWDYQRSNILKAALLKGFDVTHMIEDYYRKGQLDEIFFGMEQGIDVTPLLNPDLSFIEMRAMRKAIVSGADLSCYVDQSKQRLYVDMDGTLSKFTPVNTLEELYEEGFFRNQEPQMNVVGAVKEIIQNNPEIDVYVLSAVLSDSPYAKNEKNEWLDMYLPEIDEQHRVFTKCGEDKKNFIIGGIRPNDFLLDDYTNNLVLWQPPAKGIKLLNGINATNGTWTDNQLDYGKDKKVLADNIISIIKKDAKIIDIPPQKQKDLTLNNHILQTISQVRPDKIEPKNNPEI